MNMNGISYYHVIACYHRGSEMRLRLCLWLLSCHHTSTSITTAACGSLFMHPITHTLSLPLEHCVGNSLQSSSTWLSSQPVCGNCFSVCLSVCVGLFDYLSVCLSVLYLPPLYLPCRRSFYPTPSTYHHRSIYPVIQLLLQTFSLCISLFCPCLCLPPLSQLPRSQSVILSDSDRG